MTVPLNLPKGSRGGFGRPRACIRKFGKRSWIQFYDPKVLKQWKKKFAAQAKTWMVTTPIDGPLVMNLTFLLPRAKDSKLHGAHWSSIKPDLDNLEKTVLDALKGVVFRDDAQIAHKTVMKVTTERTSFIHLTIDPITYAPSSVLPNLHLL